MSKTSQIHSESFLIRANEVDAKGRLTLGALCNFFQEVAGNNARTLKFDITDMRDQNLTWVLHRMDMRLNKLPNWRETIRVDTWAASGDTLRAYRNYVVLDADGNELTTCLSYWMLLNLDTRRPVRIPKEVLEVKLPERALVTDIKSNRMKPIRVSDSAKKIIVRRSDLDMNNHVNNVHYIEWMMDSIPFEQTQNITSFDIIFMQETFVDEQVQSSVEFNGENTSTFLLSNSEGKPIALAEAVFR